MSVQVAETCRPAIGGNLVISGVGSQKEASAKPHRTSGIPGNDMLCLGVNNDADAVGM